MSDKSIQILKIIILLVLFLGGLFFKYLPEYKKSLGSSDSYIDSANYDDLIEIYIDNKPNFMIVTKKETINGILFFDKESLCLYNQNIENSKIEDGINIIIEQLIKYDYLKSTSTITFVKYSDKSYQKVTTSFKNYLTELNVPINYIEKTSSLEEKRTLYNITVTENEQIIKELELYSKNLVRNNKNDVTNKQESNISEEINEDNVRRFTDNVYIKIEKYIKDNNITNQEVNNTSLPITLIPINEKGNIYPDSSSWYYVQDSKVYAYISITHNNQNYSYCYQSSIDEYKKGQC